MSDSIIPARPEEARLLMHLTICSKAYWGYDYRFMAQARRQLKISADQISGSRLLSSNWEAFRAIIRWRNRTGRHQHRYDAGKSVCQAGGYGQVLAHVCCIMRWKRRERSGYIVRLCSDPHAAGFYRKMGAGTDRRSTPGMIPMCFARWLVKFLFGVEHGDEFFDVLLARFGFFSGGDAV